MAPHSPCLVRSILPLTTDSCRPRRLVQGAPSPGKALSNTLGLVAESVRILDRLAGDERIAPDWVAGLRAVDPGIDSKIDTCLARVAAAGPYLPVEDEPNSVIWRAFELPLTQEQLSQATGMTTVHVNRSLRDMRQSGLIVQQGKRLTIPDLGALETAGLFNPNYLHLDRDGQAMNANE